MLVLARREAESIMIGDDIELTFFFSGTKSRPSVKVAIEAPKDILIFRKEIYERIKQGIAKAHPK